MKTGRRSSRIAEGSCWTCRRRRIKCGLQKPTCSHCQTNDQECDYGPVAPLKWVGGPRARGRAASHRASASQTTADGDDCNPALSPSLDAVSPVDGQCMVLYFTNHVLPRFQLLGESLALDLEALMEDNFVRQSVVAVAQAHFALSQNATTTDVSLARKQSRHTAIHGLRRQLCSQEASVTTGQHLFSANVLLCMLDGMIEPVREQPGVSTWHLKGGYALLDNWNTLPTNLIAARGLQAHLLSVFATMDLVHAVLSGEKPFFDPLIWNMFAGTQAWWGSLPFGDPFLTLLKSFSEMAAFGNIVASSLPSQDEAHLTAECIPEMEALISTPPGEESEEYDRSLSVPGVKQSHTMHWRTFCRLYTLSGKIYFYRALQLRPMNDEAVQAAAREGISLLVDEVLPGMMAHCIIFPILVLGTHAIYKQDRLAIAMALTPSISYLAFGNVQLMLDWMTEAWGRQDVDATWWDTFRDVSETAFLF